MNCFPLDNTEYSAEALGAWLGTRTRGVFASDTHYAVTANGDMTVTVSPGLAWLKADTYWGTVLHEINPTALTLATADGALTRYAAVCLQLDKNVNTAGIVVKYGAYGTSPDISSLPPPAQNSLDYDEIYVAAIKIRAGATSILLEDITDLRLNETYCGVMRDGVTGIPTQALYDSWQSYIAGFKDTTQTDIEQWLESIKNLLDENAAANLANEIGELQEQVETFIAPVILSAFGWANQQYTIDSAAIPAHTATLETMIELSLFDTDFGGVTAATDEQQEAWIELGGMSEVSCIDGEYTFSIDGDVPTVDIPVLASISRATRV